MNSNTNRKTQEFELETPQRIKSKNPTLQKPAVLYIKQSFFGCLFSVTDLFCSGLRKGDKLSQVAGTEGKPCNESEAVDAKHLRSHIQGYYKSG